MGAFMLQIVKRSFLFEFCGMILFEDVIIVKLLPTDMLVIYYLRSTRSCSFSPYKISSMV